MDTAAAWISHPFPAQSLEGGKLWDMFVFVTLDQNPDYLHQGAERMCLIFANQIDQCVEQSHKTLIPNLAIGRDVHQ